MNNTDQLTKSIINFQFFLVVLLTLQLSGCKKNFDSQETGIIQNKWQSLQTIAEEGLLGERVDLWRNNRLWYIAESGYLIDGFENRPGTHPWQGEHLGKWLHAATIAYKITGDEEIKMELDEMVERLLATQLPDGYLGTYNVEKRFMNVMGSQDPQLLADDIDPTVKKNAVAGRNQQKGGWDVWTFRYNIYGLLFYEKYFPNEELVIACKKMADLLMETYGIEKYDLTQYGTRKGISATTLLESIMILYERTSEKKYLAFAEEIVTMSENNPSLQLMGTMIDGGSVVLPGEGKGYQLMANLLGYIRLYQATGTKIYLQTVLHGWEEIKTKHLLVNGGPWTRKMPYNGNRECFAYTEAFHPEKIVVEGCCDATWIQLNTQLFELTGDAKYFNEAEVTLINNVYQHQHTDGIQWCYMTIPNQERPKYESHFHCCGSSEPRGLEIYSDHLCGVSGEKLSVNTLFPSTIQLTDQFGGGKMIIKGNFPFESSAEIHLETIKGKAFTLEFRLPVNSTPTSVIVNGKKAETKQNAEGFMEIDRKWKNGDVVSVELDFKLRAHFQNGEENGRWIAFTYGPFALSQKINKMPEEEPFYDSGLEESHEFVNLLVKSSDPDVEFSIKGSDITLIPYYKTGSEQSGSRMYFKY